MSKITFEEYLQEHGTLIYKNTGTSMLPLLKQGRDAFIIKAVQQTEECKKWDVVLYKRTPDIYVLHRIIKVNEDGYDMLGDNCVGIERNIPRDAILGVMTEYIRKGKTHKVSSLWYKLYVFLWCKPYRVRIKVKTILQRKRR